MKTLTLGTLGLALVTGIAGSVAAQAAPATPAGLRTELLSQLDDAAGKLVQLAEAIPQDKYTWRPGTGVRSISEVLMHVAGGNYYLLTFAGVQPSAQLPRDAETAITAKAQVIESLKKSFDHVRASLRAARDADFDKPTTMFGRATTNRNVFLTEVTHAHEHLGQLIAYSRMNGIVPPWSAAGGGN
ncbi:MAG: DinB family protein [Gemmatimonadales bacterium]